MNNLASHQARNVADLATAFVGSKQFRHRYRPVRRPDSLFGWGIRDVANDGDDSCASFVSYVLVANNLLGRTRSTVETMVRAMERQGWHPINEAVIGGIALWGCRADIVLEDSNLGHSGICVGDDSYVSHSSYLRTPVEHPSELRDGRLPIAYYAHDRLFNTPSLATEEVLAAFRNEDVRNGV